MVPFLRSSDEIADLPLGRKLLLPLSPIYSRTGAQRELAELIAASTSRTLLHLHNPYPLLSPWVVRTAHAHDVPVVQTIHNYRHVCAAATFVRDGHDCHDCVGKRFADAGDQAQLLPRLDGAERGDGDHARGAPGHLALGRPVHRADRRHRRLSADYGIPDDRITIKPNAVARSRAARPRSAVTASCTSAG